MGRLVEQVPNDEPVPRHLDEVPGTSRKGSVVLPKVAARDIDTIPDSWAWLPLTAIIGHMDAGWSPQCEAQPRDSEDEWAVLKTTAVQQLAFDATQNKRLPQKLKPRPQYQAQVGDILVTRAGPKNRVGVSCVVDVPCPRLMISDKLIRFHPLGNMSSRYIALTLNAGRTLREIEQAKSGMAVMQMNISQEKLRSVLIPVPPMAEQLRIVSKVDELMSICDGFELALSTGDIARGRLLDALLSEALKVPTQDERLHEIESHAATVTPRRSRAS
jgi:type I restriction enzyme, S subunit